MVVALVEFDLLRIQSWGKTTRDLKRGVTILTNYKKEKRRQVCFFLVWRKLLKLRPIAYECLRFEVKDGRSVSFWFDDWLGVGKLLDITGELGCSYLGISRSATLAEAVSGNGWNIRRCGGRRYPLLCEKIAAAPLPDANTGPDIALWRHNQDDFKPAFSAAKTWEYLREKRNKVQWHRLVWFPQAVPRQAFMVWLALKDRLSTDTRMRGWGMEQNCVFCGERDASRDHLYFACSYTFTVWIKYCRGSPSTSDHTGLG